MKLHINHKTSLFNLTGIGICYMGLTVSAEAALIINEVDYDQPGSDTAEFIELYNSGPTSIDLNGYTLDLVNGSNDRMNCMYCHYCRSPLRLHTRPGERQ